MQPGNSKGKTNSISWFINIVFIATCGSSILVTLRMAQPETRTEQLAKWAAELQYADIPHDVVERTKELFLDWFGCTLAGRDHPAVSAIARFAAKMGPSTGTSELIDGSQAFPTTSPAFASLINGASSHVVEQDDLHNRSIMHPVRHAITLS